MVLRWTVNFASTRSAQIATLAAREEYKKQELCLHTLRADCNAIIIVSGGRYKLCLHTLRADCNSHRRVFLVYGCPFASTRSAQIATYRYLMLAYIDRTLPPHAPRRLQRRNGGEYALLESLCLHTLRADCNAAATRRNHFRRSLPPHAPRRLQRLAIVPPPYVKAFASTRSAQIAT